MTAQIVIGILILLLAVGLIIARLNLIKNVKVKSQWWNNTTKSIIIVLLSLSLIFLSLPEFIGEIIKKPSILLFLIIPILLIALCDKSISWQKWTRRITIFALILIAWCYLISPAIYAKKSTASSNNRPQMIYPGQLDWSRAEKYGPIDIPAGETIDTKISYKPGDLIKFTRLYNASFWMVGEEKNTFISEPVRILKGLPPEGTVWIKGNDQTARITIEIIRKT